MVAVMNEKIEPGKILNALAHHLCIGLGSHLGRDCFNLTDYIDAGKGVHPNISKMPLVVLKANSNKIAKIREQAISKSIAFTDFVDTMTIGTWAEQEKRTAETKPEDLMYYGIMLFGDATTVTEMTRKFSLWK